MADAPLEHRTAHGNERSCCWCEHEGVLDAWLNGAGEVVTWECPACKGQWPFLDFNYYWLAPARRIAYHGKVDKKLGAPYAWRESDEDMGEPEVLPQKNVDDFDWGYEGEKPENLARAILRDFYEWLSWANPVIMQPPENAKRWADKHCRAFMREVIAKLPEGRKWKLDDDAMYKALERIVPESFEEGKRGTVPTSATS